MNLRTWPLFFFLFITVCPAVYAAVQTGNCHCFRNRVYNPADKFAADDYLLTTVFNSLTAKYFSVSKRQIVMMKMKGGVSNTDLLIGLYIAQCTETDVNDLLARKKDRSSWQKTITIPPALDIPPNRCPQAEPLQKGLDEAAAAERIVRQMLQDHFMLGDQAIATLHGQGLATREVVLVLTLADHMQIKPELIIAQYKEKGLSWSEIAYNFGLEPAQVGKLFWQSASPGQ